MTSSGSLLLTVTLSTMQYVLTEGERNYWFASAGITLASVLCVTGLASFIFWELRMTDVPIVDLSIFKNRSVASGFVLALALGAVVFGSTYVVPQLTQGPLGFTPTLSGELFILRAIPIAVLTPVAARIAGRIDARWLLSAGFLLMAWGLWLQVGVTTSTSGFWSFAVPLATVGAASALLFVPLSIAVLGNTTPSEGPKAAAMVNLGVQLGGSIAVALLDVVVDRRETMHSQILAAYQNIARQPIAAIPPTRRNAHPALQYRPLSIGRARLCRRDFRHGARRAFLHTAGTDDAQAATPAVIEPKGARNKASEGSGL